jgi:hypothetical protein
MSEEIIVEFPLRGKNESKWTREYKIEYDREYRKKIKQGLIQPNHTKPDSKWKNPDFRKAYDISRREKIKGEREEKKIKGTEEKRPNFNIEQKQVILQQMIEDLKQGKEASHPYFKLGLVVVQKRKQNRKESS